MTAILPAEASRQRRLRGSVRPGGQGTSSQAVHRHGRYADAAAVVLFCALAVYVYWDVWKSGAGNVAVRENDNLQMMWVLNWVPYALGHGLNPFHSSLVNVPFGINLLDQNSIELLGLLLAPVTLLFGAAVSLTMGLTLALAGSATSMYFVMQRFTAWRLAALVAALVYGFGPFEIGQGSAHIHMAFAVLPPVMILLVHDIAVRNDGKARRRGLILGLLVIAQFFISLEMLLLTAIFGAVMLIAMALLRPAAVRSHLRDVVTGFSWCGGIAAVLLAYPVWFALAGPQHVNGALHNTAFYRADLLGAVVPDSSLRIAPSSLAVTADRFAGNPTENGSYLGLTLIATLVIGVIWLRRRLDVQLAAIMATVAFVFSLGSRLVVRAEPVALPSGAPNGRFPLPWAVLSHLPILGNVLPSRFSLFVAMSAAFLLALVLDELHTAFRARFSGSVATGVPVGVAAIALIPLIPAVPYNFLFAVPKAAYFATASSTGLPLGQTALIYPYPSAVKPDGMIWQTEADMRFAIPGGYFVVPQGPSQTVAISPVLNYGYSSVIGNNLGELYAGLTPPQTARARGQMREEILSWHVQSAVAVPAPGTAPKVVAYLTWLFGTPPVHKADAYVWSHLEQSIQAAPPRS